MLVLSRKRGEAIIIDGDVKITVSEVHGGRVKLVIDAPRDRKVVRSELTLQDQLCDTGTRRQTSVSLTTRDA